MRTEVDLNESEIHQNECEHFLKAKLYRSEMWMDTEKVFTLF